jgi:hypothetical protein
MSQSGFEPAIPATKRPQTYALTARPLGSAAIMLGVGTSPLSKSITHSRGIKKVPLFLLDGLFGLPNRAIGCHTDGDAAARHFRSPMLHWTSTDDKQTPETVMMHFTVHGTDTDVNVV